MSGSTGSHTCTICKVALQDGDEWIALDGGEIWCAGCWQKRFASPAAVRPPSPAPSSAPQVVSPLPEPAVQARKVAHGVEGSLVGSLLSPSIHDYGSRALIWGAILVVGALLPLAVPDPVAGKGEFKAIFPNLQLSGLPGQLQFQLVYPLLAGIAVALVGLLARGVGRGIALLGIGALPWVMAAGAGVGDGQFPDSVSSHLIAETLKLMWVQVVLLILLPLTILTGFRVQKAEPSSMFGRLLAGTAGSVFLLMLVLPLTPSAFARELGTMPVVIPFNVFRVSAAAGFLSLLLMGVLVAVAVMACVCFTSKRNAALAQAALRILYGTMLAAPLAGAILVGYELYRASNGVLSAPLVVLGLPLLYTVKLEALMYGSLAPLVVGAIDLYVALPKGWARSAQELRAGTGSQSLPQAAPEVFLDSEQLRDRLEDLNGLMKAGLISELDYERKKRDLLKMLRP